MSKRKARIPRRKRVYLGCEGESEQGYGGFIQRLAKRAGIPVHLVPSNLQPAGNHLLLAVKAVEICRQQEARRGKFKARALMLDGDRLGEDYNLDRETTQLLERHGFIVIWNRPNFEAFLLRHHSGHEKRSPSKDRCLAELQRVWPDYKKNTPAADLEDRFSLVDVKRAAQVNPDLARLLHTIGLPLN